MSDDLVERLLDWPYQGETMAHEAADRIEALTAQLAEDADRIYALTADRENRLADLRIIKAERDRLREALEQFLIEYDVVDLADAETSSMTAAVLEARVALRAVQPMTVQETARCEYCDGTGDVHAIDGEWRGYCSCGAGATIRALPAVQPDAAAIREAALREVLVELAGVQLFGTTTQDFHAALEQYCLCRDAILALINKENPNATPNA